MPDRQLIALPRLMAGLDESNRLFLICRVGNINIVKWQAASDHLFSPDLLTGALVVLLMNVDMCLAQGDII